MFWSGTLLSPTDLDSFPSPHAQWLAAVQARELHGKELHFSSLNKIADSIREYLQQHNCKFVFTRIDKEFHAITTFVAMLFDSDVNEAIAPLYDYVPIFKKEAARDLAKIFLSRDRRVFWTAYMKRDLGAFCELLLNLELRARELYIDKRSAQMVCEAMCWARSNPKRIMEDRINEQDSPNVRALLLLVDGIHKIAGFTARILRFRHDEQPEFKKMLLHDFELIKNAFGPLGSPYAPLRPQPAKLFSCQLEMISSTSSVGLQLIDVLLYIMSRHLNGLYKPREDACGRLLNYLRSDDRAIINQIIYSEKEFSLVDLEDMAARSSLFQSGAPSFQDLIIAAKVRSTGL